MQVSKLSNSDMKESDHKIGFGTKWILEMDYLCLSDILWQFESIVSDMNFATWKTTVNITVFASI